MDNTEFENLLLTCRNSLERLVYYKVNSKADGEDIISEVFLTALSKFSTLKDKKCFKPWIFSIAKNKITDFYRKKAKILELPLDESITYEISYNRFCLTTNELVEETLEKLKDTEKQILYLYYFKQKPQAEISKILNIPVGTVKSRLYNAKQNFKEIYPYSNNRKEETIMKILPEIIPEIKINKSSKNIFPVKWEETMGWFIVPKLNEKISWAMYDYPQKKKTESFEIEVVGKAIVHGIEGVEIISKETNGENIEHQNSDTTRTFVAQLTDTHCRILLESHFINNVKYTNTFYDEEFLNNWGFGENNCGN
ncbi:MAG: sigma-70 family RNA polymerase sigma factor [Oscillospiraceae bacterium]